MLLQKVHTALPSVLEVCEAVRRKLDEEEVVSRRDKVHEVLGGEDAKISLGQAGALLVDQIAAIAGEAYQSFEITLEFFEAYFLSLHSYAYS